MFKKAAFLVLGLLFCVGAALAQPTQTMTDISPAVHFAQLLLSIKVLSVGLYAALEALVRAIPTARSWSPLTYVIHGIEWIINFLKVIIPDNTTDGATHDKIPAQTQE
jgi:hypothetical protein